jgi:high affinity Mn2+ porin
MQFLSTGFVNQLAVAFPDDNGIGVRLTLSPIELLDISVGVAEADADWEDIFGDGFGILEVAVRPTIGELQGNYRLYAWVNSTDYHDVDDWDRVTQALKPGRDPDETGSGFGVSFDQQVTPWLTLFARGAIQDDDIYELEASWSAGFALSGSIYGRDDDVIGVAYGEAIVNEDYRALDDSGAFVDYDDFEDEGHLELYYSFKVNDNLTLSPDIQVIWDAAGDDDADTVTIFGARAQLDF